jgi:hypothetical protein
MDCNTSLSDVFYSVIGTVIRHCLPQYGNRRHGGVGPGRVADDTSCAQALKWAASKAVRSEQSLHRARCCLWRSRTPSDQNKACIGPVVVSGVAARRPTFFFVSGPDTSAACENKRFCGFPVFLPLLLPAVSSRSPSSGLLARHTALSQIPIPSCGYGRRAGIVQWW